MNLANWSRVVCLEAEAERAEFHRWMSEATIEQAEMRGYGMTGMEISGFSQDWFHRMRVTMNKINPSRVSSSFKKGQILSISRSVGSRSRVETFAKRPKITTGVVIKSNMEGHVELAIENDDVERLMDCLEEIDDAAAGRSIWDLSIEESDRTNQLRMQLISDFKHISNQQIDLFNKLAGPSRYPACDPVDSRTLSPSLRESQPLHLPDEFQRNHPNLNTPQLRAVANSLRHCVSCIHGPPGTGKTTTVAELITELHSLKKTVLITGPSNISVDNVLALCVKNPNLKAACVRLGHPARHSLLLREYSFDHVAHASDMEQSCQAIKDEISQIMLVRASGTLKKIKSEDLRKRLTEKLGEDSTKKAVLQAAKLEKSELVDELFRREKLVCANVLDQRTLVFSTCVGAMVSDLAQQIRVTKKPFDYVIIDEAAKATVLDSLMPIKLGLRVVLAGDHKQLRATVKSKEADRMGLGVSLMERLINEETPAIMLQVQYRMNTDLMNWSSAQFYGSALKADESVAEQRLGGQISGLYWLDTADISDDVFKETTVTSGQTVRDPSKFNVAEAVVVKAYINNLLEKFGDIESIGVISFYARQVKLLDQYLRSEHFSKQGNTSISVETVDGFQGKEADVIVLSMVRSNRNAEVGFLSEATRINVSVTRARRHCAIIGDSKTVAKKDDLLQSLHDACVVETCLTQISLEEIIEQKRILTQRFLQDDFGAADERIRDPKAKPSRPPPRRFNQSNLSGKDTKYRRRVEAELKKLSPSNPEKIYQNLRPFQRMIVHEVAGSLGLEHKSIGAKPNVQLFVRFPKVEDLNSRTQRSSTFSQESFATSSERYRPIKRNDFRCLVSSTSSNDEDDDSGSGLQTIFSSSSNTGQGF